MPDLHSAPPPTASNPVCSEANIQLIRSHLHSLANTIAGIQSAAEMLSLPQPDASPQADPAATIRAGALEARCQLQSISAMLHGSRGRPEFFDAREQLEQVIEHLRRAIPTDVTVELRSPSDSVPANAPLHDFQVAAAEALLQSLKSLSQGGPLTIRLHREAQTVTVTISSPAGSRELRLPAC